MAGWTAPRTWVTSEVVTAALLNAHVRDNLTAMNGYAVKTADQSVTSSTVLVNDTHLSYTIGAVGTYVFDVFLMGNSAADAAGDINLGFSFPTGTCDFMGIGPHNSLATGSNVVGEWIARNAATSGVTATPYGLSLNGGIPLTIHLHGRLAATATGTLRLMWAQQTSNANASTLKAGSHMTVTQVA